MRSVCIFSANAADNFCSMKCKYSSREAMTLSSLEFDRIYRKPWSNAFETVPRSVTMVFFPFSWEFFSPLGWFCRKGWIQGLWEYLSHGSLHHLPQLAMKLFPLIRRFFHYRTWKRKKKKEGICKNVDNFSVTKYLKFKQI